MRHIEEEQAQLQVVDVRFGHERGMGGLTEVELRGPWGDTVLSARLSFSHQRAVTLGDEYEVIIRKVAKEGKGGQ